MLRPPKLIKPGFIWALLTHTDQFNNYEKDVNDAKKEMGKYYASSSSSNVENVFVFSNEGKQIHQCLIEIDQELNMVK